jgi:hypothetical protein
MKRKKDIMGLILDRLFVVGRKDQVKHKQFWLDFLQHGEIDLNPERLHRIISEAVEQPENWPRGGKLFKLRRQVHFTAKVDGKPFRPEEALERLIINSNIEGNIFNQIPIGGGKESIDIGIKENRKFIFVELKPWSSKNSPLYTIIQGLKNLVEYRVIHEKKIKNIDHFEPVDLTVLAPEAYYQEYRLIDGAGDRIEENVKVIERLMGELAKEFNTKITLKYLNIGIDTFIDACKKAYDASGAKRQQKICLRTEDSLPSLALDRWILLAGAG